MNNTICDHGNVHLIGVQKKYLAAVSVRTCEALDDAANILKYKKNVDVAIFDAESWDIHPKMGLTAHARVYGIDIKICFYRKDIASILDTELPTTLLHEFSHVVRFNTIGYGDTLLDDVISEGIACYIEQTTMPERHIPYIQKIPNEKALWGKAKNQFSKKISSELHNEWFFGTGMLPDWAGYRLGYMVVEQFIKKHSIGLDKLVRLNSKDILDRSGF